MRGLEEIMDVNFEDIVFLLDGNFFNKYKVKKFDFMIKIFFFVVYYFVVFLIFKLVKKNDLEFYNKIIDFVFKKLRIIFDKCIILKFVFLMNKE